MKKSRVWQAIVPGTQNKPQDTLQIRKTPWHGVTKQPAAVPLPGPNVTPEPNEKIKGLAGNCSRRTKKATRHPSTLARRDETAPNVTPEPNEKIKGLAGNCSRHTKQATRHPSNQENTLARRDETASCPEPNEKIKGLAGNCSRHTNQATRHPSNQENTLARRDETASCRPSARPNVTPEPNGKNQGSGRQLFQAHKTGHKTPFKSGKHPGTARRNVPGTQNKPPFKSGKHLARPDETASCQTSLLNRMKKSRVWQAIVPGTQDKPQDTLQIRKTPWHGDETASCRPSAPAKRHS